MSKKVLLIGCGVSLVLFIVLIFAGAIGYFVWIIEDPEGIAVSAETPSHVSVGEIFDLTVSVDNKRESKDFKLSDIDISEEYLNGFSIVSIDPPPKSSMHIPIFNMTSFTFDSHIPAGEKRIFIFKLRGEIPGVFRNDLDVCEGQRFVTTIVQTVVKK